MFFRFWVVAAVISLVLGNPDLPEEKNGGTASKALSEQGDKKVNIWVVLVAGSFLYGNYRHQADVCHAYQIFHEHGVPDENIIVMMYDDIANNPQNPYPGVIINEPNGPNVYKNVLKDYTKDDVTPENFINIITGNKSAMHGIGSGKVLQSGPNDIVFIGMMDKGGIGKFCFPKKCLYADVLNTAIEKMDKQNMYKKLLMYVESSYSGSMFDKLLHPKLNVLAITACKPDEQSYSTYWDSTRNVYLANMFSAAWMQYIDSEYRQKNYTTDTIENQYNSVVKSLLYICTPSLYGKLKIKKSHESDFFGKGSNKTAVDRTSARLPSTRNTNKFQEVVPSQDVILHTLQNNIESAESSEEKQKLQNELDALLKGRREIETLLERILSHLPKADLDTINGSQIPLTLETFPCYRALVDSFNKECVNVTENTFVLRLLYKFANICAAADYLMGQVLEAFQLECSQSSTFDNIH